MHDLQIHFAIYIQS